MVNCEVNRLSMVIYLSSNGWGKGVFVSSLFDKFFLFKQQTDRHSLCLFVACQFLRYSFVSFLSFFLFCSSSIYVGHESGWLTV